jgi:hypothetical protein
MELMVIQQCLALVTALVVAQRSALLCISQCARVAAKTTHMIYVAWLDVLTPFLPPTSLTFSSYVNLFWIQNLEFVCVRYN